MSWQASVAAAERRAIPGCLHKRLYCTSRAAVYRMRSSPYAGSLGCFARTRMFTNIQRTFQVIERPKVELHISSFLNLCVEAV